MEEPACRVDEQDVSVSRCVVLLYAASCPGWSADDPAERIRAAMQASLERQRASIRLQTQTAQTASEAGFFTIPWPAPPVLFYATPVCDPLPAAELDPIIQNSAQKHGVKPDLIRAVIRKESAGRPCVESPKGAQGLMQIMPATAADYGVADPFEPRQNVDAGTRYLKSMLERFRGELPLALGAYNAGPAAVDRDGGIPKNAETQEYVAEILKLLRPEPAVTGSAPQTATPSAGTPPQ
jgi:soluble lytic murein transglycosylase-like protein